VQQQGIEEVYRYTDQFAEMILFKDENGFRKLNINNGLQFMERDEHRYHQAVFMMPSLFTPSKEQRVLILGGGDGLGARELLKLPTVKSVDLVDISDSMIFMSSKHPEMTILNNNSLIDERVTVHVEDSNAFIERAKEANEKWDLIILDYPDPSVDENSPINYLFSKEHYADVMELLDEDGVMSIQSTSVYISPNVFSKIRLNLSYTATSVFSMVVNIQSFGDIGVLFVRNNKRDREVQENQMPAWKLEHTIPAKAFFTEHSINKFLYFLEDEKPTIALEDIDKISIPDLIKYDISADGKRIENNFFTNETVPSRSRLISVSEEEAENVYEEHRMERSKSVKDIFISNGYLLGYPNSGYEKLDEDDVFFKSLDTVKDKDGNIEAFLRVRQDDEFTESEFAYINNISNSPAFFKLYDKHLAKTNYKPLLLTYWEHNVLTQNLVNKFDGEIIEEGYTWNIEIKEVDINKRRKKDLKLNLGNGDVFVYNGILGCWETNWVDTKHSVRDMVNLCIENDIPNLSIFSRTPPVEFDFYKYKVAKLDFSEGKASRLLKAVVKRIQKKEERDETIEKKKKKK
jgi:spermidine synthase